MVSIVIPTYRRVDLLERLLKSIEHQTFKEFEVIVVDDCSPNQDEYKELIDSFKGRIEKLTFLVNSDNRGAPYSRNRGIMTAKYDFIALVDDDDEWKPEKLQKQIDTIQLSPDNTGLFYTWTDVVDATGVVVGRYRSEISGYALKAILKECFVPSPSVIVRRHAIIDAGLFDEKFPSCQDWDMWTRILSRGYRCAVTCEVVTIYHKHSRESIGMSTNAKKGYAMYYIKHIRAAFRSSISLGFYYVRRSINLRFGI